MYLTRLSNVSILSRLPREHTFLFVLRCLTSVFVQIQMFPQKTKNVQKMTPKSDPKSDPIFGVLPPGAPLGAQSTFSHWKWAPALPKCFQWSKIDPKMIPKNPKIAKKSSKRQAFRALRNIMKQKNATTQHTNIFTIMKNPALRTAQKVTPKDPKRSKHDFKCAFVEDLAWRTSRSAFNKIMFLWSQSEQSCFQALLWDTALRH